MLTAEEARARLLALRHEDWRTAAATRVASLERAHRRPVTLILEPTPRGLDPAERARHDQQVVNAAAYLDELDHSQRAACMAALHPALGEVVAHWWVAAQAEPYTWGWARRAFRAPHDPTATRVKRVRDLRHLLERVGPYDGDAVWLAAWAPHLGLEDRGYSPSFARDAGGLLAAAIDLGGSQGQRVLETLVEVGSGEHPVGVMGRHVIVGLLGAARPEGWDFVERLLLAAQRQEGLRQAILEVADEAHPDAFDRLLDLVVDHDLLRFAATVRAVSVWFGFPADVRDIPELSAHVDQLRRCRRDAAARAAALAGDDPWEIYIALCAQAMRDVAPALDEADRALHHPDPGVRAAAVRFVGSASMDRAPARLARMLDDPDLAVAMVALSQAVWGPADGVPSDVFDRLERLARRLPATPRSTGPIGIERDGVELSRSSVVSAMLRARGERSLSVLLPWLGAMGMATRRAFAAAIGEDARLTPELREVVVKLAGDHSDQVRQVALHAIDKLDVTASEAPALEALLTRRAADLRRGVIKLLAKQAPAEVVRSAERLWAAAKEAQRDAACELLRLVPDRPPSVLAAARSFAAAGLTERQSEQLGDLVGDPDGADEVDLDDPGLGLFDPARRTPVPSPGHRRGVRLGSDAALRIVGALDDLADAYRDTTITVTTWQGAREMLLADVTALPSPFGASAAAPEEEGRGLVLDHVFRGWWAERPEDCRDDHLDALRALAAVLVSGADDHLASSTPPGAEWWTRLLVKLIGGRPGELRHGPLVRHVLAWVVVADAADDAGPLVDACLDAVEATWAAVPSTVVRSTPDPPAPGAWNRELDWRIVTHDLPWTAVLRGLLTLDPTRFRPDQLARWFRLMRWLDEPRPGCDRHPVDRQLLLAAHAVGAATDDDLLDQLLRPGMGLLNQLTRRRPSHQAQNHRAVALAGTVRERVVWIERRRGDTPTHASRLARELGSITGASLTMDLLRRLGRSTLVRNDYGTGREAVLSSLIRVSYPADDDTAEALRRHVRDAGVGDRRLVELAVYAPQWAALVEHALGWDGLEDAVWWFHAHTMDDQWSVDAEIRESWAALSAERTPLTARDLIAGAVDVDWFTRCHATLGAERWRTVHRAARFASGRGGHRRAQLFAEALLGEVDEAVLMTRITTKRHQDAVQALGLLPVPRHGPERDAEMLRRYRVLREFERGSSKFSSQRQASERLAVRIAIDNLARNAGYHDPQRFTWAMEAAEAGPLADGPVAVTEGDVTVTLSVDAEGTPDLSIRRGSRTLKSVPAAVRKSQAVSDLRQRKTSLTRQASRVRGSLEAAMVRQDTFARADLAALERHPIVAPMLRLLVFTDASGQTLRRTSDGFADVDGVPATPTDGLRLAHPTDLAASGSWTGWQEQLFVGEQRQPFKQAFRELYTLTESERTTGPGSRRYEGHQIQPRQAMALLSSRGWLTDQDHRDVSRAFHRHGVVARLDFLDGFLTPADVELPTLGAVCFTRPGEHLAQPLDDVPPVVFSETMRDLDLVVSVAHAGGVDPEATSSTVDMRSALVRETTRLLKLDNVRLVDSHVVVEGVLGEYSVHLGSGVVHRRPGGAICIVPVDSQRRGRIFLPFADDDPKTAEIVAKVLLLANDRDIKDPTILGQLRS